MLSTFHVPGGHLCVFLDETSINFICSFLKFGLFWVIIFNWVPPNAEQEQNKPHVIRASQEIRNRPGPRAQPRTSCSPSSRTSKQRRSPKTSWMKHRCPGKPEGSGDSSEVQGQWLPACVSSMAGRGALPSVSEGRRMLPIEQGQPFSHTRQLCHRPFSHQWASLWPSGGLQEVNVAAKEVLSGDRELRSHSSF